MHHLGHDRPSNSRPYAWKCFHGHMYLVLETFRLSKSPTRLSCRWRRIVRQISLIHHLGHDRPSNSRPYAQKCSHGHMYLVLETFRRSKSAARLSCRWRRIVRQLSHAPPPTRSTEKFPSLRMKMFPRTHVPRARNLPPVEIAHSAKLQVETNCTTTL